METCRPDKPIINIFKMLKLREERYHNAMLAWLLDPDQSHGFDDAFLSRFLERVGVKNYVRDNFQGIQAEYTLQTVRPDIFIETGSHKIYIENKVSRGSINDQQLKNQALSIGEDAGDKEGIHVFIVPRRSDIQSSTKAVVKEHGICALEWSELAELLREVIGDKDDADPHARAILEQHLDYAEEVIARMFCGFDVEEMRKYVEAAEVMWRFEKGESPTKRQIEGFLTIVAEEVLSQLSDVVSSEWESRVEPTKPKWAPVSWGAYFTSDEHYSDIEFYIEIWYAPPEEHPADGLLRASVGVHLYGERISQLTKVIDDKSRALTERTPQSYTMHNVAVREYEERFDGVPWSSLEQWPSFRDRLVARTVAWMKLIPVIEKTLQPLQKKQRAKKQSTAPR